MELDVRVLGLSGAKILKPPHFVDERGFFTESYQRDRYLGLGIADDFVQDNCSLSVSAGVVRGLHFQIAPFAQAKLLRVMRGRLLDVIVDLRRGSPTFGQHEAVELSLEGWSQIYVPVGFAHGFCTLDPNTEVHYKVSAPYSPPHERGLLWNDAALGIRWPVAEGDAILSPRDHDHPSLAELPPYFEYRG